LIETVAFFLLALGIYFIPTLVAGNRYLIGIAMFIFFVMIVPIEGVTESIAYDAAITKTCYQRHGFNFISRWACRSALHSIGAVRVSVACAVRTGSDFCDNLKIVSEANKP
jgi:hypothetical protein